MKKLIFLLLAFLLAFIAGRQPSQAQNLWGMTRNGGEYDAGVIFNYNPYTNVQKVVHSFSYPEGSEPFGSLLLASNGNLYGMTGFGGANGGGVLFEYERESCTYVKKIDFGGVNGSKPFGSLIEVEGKLYGMTYEGGNYGYGVIFEYDLTTATISRIFHFNASTGAHPYGDLMKASNGKLYGLTYTSGSGHPGTFFEFDYINFSMRVIKEYKGIRGVLSSRDPYGSLIQATNGNLYGMSKCGLDAGDIFEYVLPSEGNSEQYNIIYHFTTGGPGDGYFPYGNLIEAPNGKLYGLTKYNKESGNENDHGVIFEIDPAVPGYISGYTIAGTPIIDNPSYFTKHIFGGAPNDGEQPLGSLAMASNGKLYGLTQCGGPIIKYYTVDNVLYSGYADYGVLFEFDPVSNSYTKKIDFDSINGSNPEYTTLIEVDDPLVAVCKNTTLFLDVNGNATLDPASVDGGSTGNNIILSVSKTDFTCSDVGDNTVMLTVTDNKNNTATCTAGVTIRDNTAPAAVCRDITIQLDETGHASIVAEDVDGSSTDACGIAGLSIDKDKFTCEDTGSNEVVLTVTDKHGNQANCTAMVNIEDKTAPVAKCKDITVQLDENNNVVIVEGDIDSGSTDACGIQSMVLSKSTFSCSDAGPNPVTLTVTDFHGNTSGCTAIVTVMVSSSEPVNITAYPVDPIPVGNAVALTISDVKANSVLLEWGDGTSGNYIVTGNIATASHSYAVPGVYTPSVIINGTYGGTNVYAYNYVVVYDPNGSFVTGGGWINSPAGALKANPSATGKANFGFESKYKKGQTIPEGNTEFQYKTANLNFRSTSFEWLVISGFRAQFKGSGTVNGMGNFGFILTAIDGNLSGTVIPDKFRIKIWEKTDDEVVYDNNQITDLNADPETTISGGSIVIHTTTKKSALVNDPDYLTVNPALNVYPNPFTDRLRFEFMSPVSIHARIDVFDLTGHLIKTVFNNPVEAGVICNAEFIPVAAVSGMYFYRMTLGEEVFNGKIMYKK